MSEQNFMMPGPTTEIGKYKGYLLRGQYQGPIEVSGGERSTSVVVYEIRVIRDGKDINKFASDTILQNVLPREADVQNQVKLNQETERLLREAAIENTKHHIDSGNVDIEDPSRVSVNIS